MMAAKCSVRLLRARGLFSHAKICAQPAPFQSTPLKRALKDLDKLAEKATKRESNITTKLVPRFMKAKSDSKRDAIRDTIEKEFIKLGSMTRRYKIEHEDVIDGNNDDEEEEEDSVARSPSRSSGQMDDRDTLGKVNPSTLQKWELAIETLDQGLLLLYGDLKCIGVIKEEDHGMMKNLLGGCRIEVPNRYSPLRSLQDLALCLKAGTA